METKKKKKNERQSRSTPATIKDRRPRNERRRRGFVPRTWDPT